MSVAALIDDCRRAGLSLRRVGNRLDLAAPVPPPADLMERLREAKPELLDTLPDEAPWREAVDRLHHIDPPAGVMPGQWPEFLFAVDVLARWLPEAVPLGWSVVDLFGLQSGRDYPLSVEGGLALETMRHGADVVLLTATEALLRRRDRSGVRVVPKALLPPWLVAPWELPRP